MTTTTTLVLNYATPDQLAPARATVWLVRMFAAFHLLLGLGVSIASVAMIMDRENAIVIGLQTIAAAMHIVVGVLMFRGRGNPGIPGATCNREKAPKVLGYGGLTGAFSGFFGIGGGFLIVPGLVASTGMPILNAIGSSMVAVTAFGLTTALSYAFSGLVDWPLAAVFIGGGVLGGLIGARVAGAIATRKGVLNTAFAGLIIAVAVYMAANTFRALI